MADTATDVHCGECEAGIDCLACLSCPDCCDCPDDFDDLIYESEF